MILASLSSLAAHAGYPAVILLVMAESCGVPFPGETALIAAALLAATHHLSIVLVILFAAAGAIVGGGLGYLIGYRGGRWLLERPGPFLSQRQRVLETGEPFFARHGAKAVFFGRFVIGLRTWNSWIAGATRMPLPTYLAWNAAGGIAWATLIGLLAYYAGHSVETAIEDFGLYALPAVALAGAGLFLVHRRTHRHR